MIDPESEIPELSLPSAHRDGPARPAILDELHRAADEIMRMVVGLRAEDADPRTAHARRVAVTSELEGLANKLRNLAGRLDEGVP